MTGRHDEHELNEALEAERDTLLAKVSELREELAAEHAGRVARAAYEQVVAERDVLVEAVKALPEKWRTDYVGEMGHGAAHAAKQCADELEQATKEGE